MKRVNKPRERSPEGHQTTTHQPKFSPIGNSKKPKIPNISAKSWAVFDVNKMRQIGGKREYQRREVASLTKIMTCHVVIELCKHWKLNPRIQEVTVSEVASDIRGTSA